MDFTEEKAEELKLKFNLSQSIVNKWRFRNSIPEKYFTNNSDEKSNEILIKRILNIVNLKILNITVLAKLTNTLPKQFYSGKFKIEETKKIKKELIQLRLDIQTAFKYDNSENIKKILYDKRFYLKIVLKDIDNVYYSRCLKQKNELLDKETLLKLKNEFFKFSLLLNTI